MAFGARVERAKRLAALGDLARVAGAGSALGVNDRGVATGATDGVAEQRSCRGAVGVGFVARCEEIRTDTFRMLETGCEEGMVANVDRLTY